jgi:type IV pilus assembly protein PilC
MTTYAVEKTGFLKKELTSPRVKREEVMHLSRQLGAFIRAGLPLVDAVRMLGEEARNSAVRKMMAQVEEGLRSGEKLSDCFDRHPKIFPEFYRGILRSAELTGKLDEVLEQLAAYLERDLEARRKIKQATIYPAVIAVMSVVTVAVLASFVLPRFKVFFESLDAELPLPTRMLLSATDFLTQWWWALAGGVVVLVLAIVVALRTHGGRLARDKLVLKVPVLGNTIQYALTERFSRILSSMVSAGVALPEALRVASDSLRNLVFVRALGGVGEALLEGAGLARPLAATARYYEGELDYKLKKLTALFEPIVIIVMGLVVGFVAIALVSAMYGIFNQVNVQ